MKELVIATTNRKKKKELKNLLKGLGIRLLSLNDFKNIPGIKEDGKTFARNAAKKAVVTSKITKRLVLADDSGLEVEALGGRPGVLSSRFSGPGATDYKNNKKLLKLLKGIPSQRRKARFVCSVAIAERGRLLTTVTGTCSGIIGFERKGRHGFGYDPLFIVPRYGKTFAQLGPAVKNKISHRAKALGKARRFIERYL